MSRLRFFLNLQIVHKVVYVHWFPGKEVPASFVCPQLTIQEAKLLKNQIPSWSSESSLTWDPAKNNSDWQITNGYGFGNFSCKGSHALNLHAVAPVRIEGDAASLL